jgi:hypothetical protein
MFIVTDIIYFIRFDPLFVDIYHIMICNKFNKKKLDKELGLFIYLSMIDGHTIYVEFQER